MAVKWPAIKRDQYLRMMDRHVPFGSALLQFVSANKVGSVVEIGCGVAHLSHFVDEYVGIDTNADVLRANDVFYSCGRWINKDWRYVDPSNMRADLAVASSLIEHCESFEPLLEWMIALPSLYSVVTFHKGLRSSANIRRDRTGPLFDNYYCRADLEAWLGSNVDWAWHLYDLPLSRSRFLHRRESVLVIDRTGKADLSMWSKRAL